eukprot:TRINITY_DN32028_c0_g1_i1.p3 TRINITY_DN32028_c0_g1~~TRINITY_DN32028_c0_g1_i1.p3  ORF type:complete len:194 (+),score=47.77 TRINITY_DN32028_c0_g1_i1:679-1260(+)
MGNGATKNDDLNADETQELCQCTQFSAEEIPKLHRQFKIISSSINKDGLIDEAEFQQAFGLRDGVFARRLFRLFDANGDSFINFAEFVKCLSVFSRGTLGDRIAYSFRLYDIDGDGFIDKRELFTMLKASARGLTDEQMHTMVDSTFAEADTNSDELISLQEYEAMVRRHPRVIDNLSINLTPYLGGLRTPGS